jgi:hypothetical protein
MKRLTLFVISLTLAVIACGAPVSLPANSDVLPTAVTKDTHINTEPSTDVNMTVCNSGGWLNIRPAAGDLSTSNGELVEGESVTVRMPFTVMDDMGAWIELADGRGWVNFGFLCGAE